MICTKKYYIGFIFLLVSISLFYFMFIDMAVPPIMGWWNYYGWRLAEGDVLYKDIFCYLPPYIPFFQLFLYKLLGMKLFAFQIIGICFVVLGSILVYSFLCKYYKAYFVAISVFTGVVIAAGFMPHLPFDYNPIMLLMLIVMAYSVANIQEKSYLYTSLSGLSMGCLLMIKQTMLLYLLLLIVGLFLIKFRSLNFKHLYTHVSIAFISMCIAVLPAIIYLTQNGIVEMAVNEIFKSTAAKGYSSDIAKSFFMVIKRYLQYGFSLTNISIALLLTIKYCDIKAIFNKYINVILINLLAFKVLRTLIISIPLDAHITTFILLSALSVGVLNIFLLGRYEGIKQKMSNVNTNNLIYIVIILCLIFEVVLLLFPNTLWIKIYNFGNGQFFFLLKRAFSEIAFYFNLFVIITYTVKDKQYSLYNERLIIFIYCVCCFQGLLLIGSGSLDEAFSMPTVAFMTLLILQHESCPVKFSVLLLVLLILITSILQKQMIPYAWHGWQSVGLGDIKTKFIYSKVNNLEGYKLDVDTENAYKNIVDAINIYTQKDDSVYEFPHITLFNCLTERKMGTFAVSHFVDVCPDKILLEDIERLKKHTPDMFIYMKIDEGSWRINEEFFRNGRYSARIDMKEYYEDYIENNYMFVYNYKNMYVWVKKTTNKQNLQYAISLLSNYANNYNHSILKEYMESININDYQYIVNNVDNWTVNDCIRELLKKNVIVYNSMNDDDYMHIIPGISSRVSGIPAMEASFWSNEK